MTVNPLRYGSGVKGKIIASLAAGVPVVTTPIGNEGIGLRVDVEALVGDSPHELAEHVISVLQDVELAERLAAAGKRLIAEMWSDERASHDLRGALGL